MPEEFFHTIEDVLKVYPNARKDTIKRYLTKHFNENVDYQIQKNALLKSKSKTGGAGHNKEDIFLTEKTLKLCISSYGLKNRYDPRKQEKTIMTLENQTIGFITTSFKSIFRMERQFKIGRYFADLCFIDFNLVIECDEFGHVDRDINQEKEREKFIIEKGFKIIRFNPNDVNFDMPEVLNKICKVLFILQKRIVVTARK
jgi:very-short-patch-repair endonuclease